MNDLSFNFFHVFFILPFGGLTFLYKKFKQIREKTFEPCLVLLLHIGFCWGSFKNLFDDTSLLQTLSGNLDLSRRRS